ncbi:MAG: hypothetical protein HY842_09330 [Bacteroidetes bacterium]|nr:hypothetical protein [Bacteroidota bacterium]
MSKKYKFLEATGLHYVTATTAGWVDLFTRKANRDILIDCLKWCQENKGLHICAYVIMTNHLHMVAYTDEIPLGKVLQSFKKFTAAKLLEVIEEQPESRREWLVRLLGWFGRQKGQEHQVWQHENHPVALWSPEVVCQKIKYIHENPVRAGFVAEPEHWLYGSSASYAGIGFPLLEVEILDLWGGGAVRRLGFRTESGRAVSPDGVRRQHGRFRKFLKFPKSGFMQRRYSAVPSGVHFPRTEKCSETQVGDLRQRDLGGF